MTALAAIRPDAWNLPLFLHALSAFVLVGALVMVMASLAGASRNGSAAAVRLGFRSLLLAALPAWIVMRVSAQWLLSEENLDEEAPGWVDIGFITSESTLLLLIAATVCAGVAAPRAPWASAISTRGRCTERPHLPLSNGELPPPRRPRGPRSCWASGCCSTAAT
jgi:hypothetical protein